jgi:thioredoxin 1
MAKVINTDQFRNSVENNKGVVVVDFYATWCAPCKMLSPVFESIGEELENEARFVKIDIDESLEIARQFNVATVPTVMIFKDGKPVDSLIGFVPGEKIKAKVLKHL